MTGYQSIGKRVKTAFVLFCLLFAFLAYHLYGVQIRRHEELYAKAREKYTIETKKENVRGEIFDRNGNLLVGNSPVGNIIADPCAIEKENDCRETAAFLARELDLPEAEIYQKLSAKTFVVTDKNGNTKKRFRRYVLLKKDIPFDIFERNRENIAQAKLRGISCQISLKRTYPKNTMLANILGFTTIDRDRVTARSGLEKSFDRNMSSVAGKIKYERSRDGAPLVFGEISRQNGHDGYNLYLTIREPIQSILEEEIDKLMETSQAKRAYMVMADPYTGDILAVAQRPTFNPNDRSNLKPSSMGNPIAEMAFEPGSIMKPFAVAGALDMGLVRPNSMIDCENGCWIFAGKKLGDSHKIGRVTVSEVIKESSNIGTAKIAVEIGEPRLKNLLSSFGFGQRTGAPLQPETVGQFYRNPTKISITRYPIGQGLSVSPLQMVRAYCMLANGGHQVKLRFVDRIVHSNGIVEKIPVDKGKKIFHRAETSSEILSMMRLVTEPGGTGTAAAVRGYYVAGKTGTAQKVVNGRYSHKVHTSSFVGIIPASRPRFVLLVTADEPVGKQYGGEVAGPYFSSAAARTLKYLRETPEVDYETYDENLKIAKKREIERKVRIWAKEREERERRKAGLRTPAAAPVKKTQSARNAVRPVLRHAPQKRSTVGYRKNQASSWRNQNLRRNQVYSQNTHPRY
ncbi:MAG: penicillin-binding protein 2 [Lentisphaeria bacterium]|nr:penicillin-binding protein 2 [Lentisphaeria bacterium]